MNVREAYNDWSVQYDTNVNPTRDLEGVALREMLADVSFERVLEIGCGTGKNTAWLSNRASEVTAVDFSENMLAKAKTKIKSEKVHFAQANVLGAWDFAEGKYDLVTFSLVLEHIENLNVVFEKVAAVTRAGSHVYVGEFHPFKQYSGSKARFETEAGTQVLTCFDHHVSGFLRAAFRSDFELITLNEHFDNKDKTNIPRILTILLRNWWLLLSLVRDV